MKITDIPADEIRKNAEERGFSGVISFSSLEQDVSQYMAFGLAERTHQILNNTETKFAIASGSKVFTAVAVGMLIQEGKIKFETRLSECVRSREFSFASEVTIGQLLNHTSGIPDYFDEEENSDFAELWKERACYGMISVEHFLPLFEKKAMKSSPGSIFLYSNSGYILLGLVIEELTGRNFREFVEERIFQVGGMMRTGYFAMNALPKNTASGYLLPVANEYRTNIYSLPVIGGPDGGAFTTAGDMHLFWKSFFSGKFLSEKMINCFIAPSVRIKNNDESRHYGYGVYLRKDRESWIVSVVGNDPGVSMISRVWLKDSVIMSVFSNIQDGAWSLIRWMDEKIKDI